MSLAFDPAQPPPHLRTFLGSLGPAAAGLDLGLDTRDEMLAFLLASQEGDLDRALFAYFRSGASIADSMGQILRWRFGAGLERLESLLDFASGYGRVTRFLTRLVPAGRISVADIYAEGVRFQEERFGVRGLVSTVRPEELRCADRFDAILVTSLFTHLPEGTFVGWLRVLLDLLRPGGLLVFSAHSPELLAGPVEMPESGLLFAELSESGSLAKSDYGSSWVTEAFVRRAVAAAGGREASVHRLPRGLCNFQDLFLVAPEPDVDWSGLAFQSEPQLFVERAEIREGGRLELSGWAAARSGSVRSLELRIDGDLRASTAIDLVRPDVAAFFGDERYARAGWRLDVGLPANGSLSAPVVTLTVIDGRGSPNVLLSSSIEGALLASSRHEAASLRVDLAHREAAWALERQTLAARADELEARIRAMEASRFWKLRNLWFRFKERAGWEGSMRADP